MAEPEQALINVAEETTQDSIDEEQTVPEDVPIEETAPSAVPEEPEREDAEGLDFLGEDSSDDEEVVVKIGDIKQNVPYQKSAAAGGAGGTSKVDLDGQPTHKGTMIYDLDLASMEDKPWRKPGADITDYFNYGFNEETWNYYCERQKKLRAEYGTNQAQINRFLFNNISLGVPQLTTTTGGRQLVNICGPEKPQKVNKVVIDLSRPPPNSEGTPIPIMRTVLTAPSAVSQSPKISETMHPNFGAPPPSTSDPRSTISDISLSSSTSPTGLASHSIPTVDFSRPPPTRDAAPGEELPPGVEDPGPPGSSVLAASIPPVQSMAIPSLGGMTPSINTSMPPPGFNPNVPPPGIPPVRLGGMPPPAMNVPPPSFYGGLPNHASAGFSSGSVGFSRPPPLLTGRSGGYEREYDRGGDSGDDEYYARRSRRKRSRSRSPDSRRRREDKDRERRHESPPYEGRRHKDDRDRDRSDKKRSRTDDRESEDRERKRRKHERSERSDKKRSSTREDRREKDYSTSRDIKQEIVDSVEDEGLRPPGED